MKRDLTEQSRTTGSRTERIRVPKRLSVISTLAFLAFVLLGMCGAQTAHAQTFFITPNNPAAITGTNDSQGSEGTDPTFTVGLTDGVLNAPYQITVSTANGTAQAGTDYTALTTTLSFVGAGAGNTVTQLVTVGVINDNLNEPSETFTVSLSGPTGGATRDPARTTVTYTILDNDPAPGAQFFITPNNPGPITATTSQGFEDQNPTFTVGLIGGATDQTYRVNVATANGTALAGQDYYNLGTQLTFNGAGPGNTVRQTVTVRIIDDGSDELSETFTVGLSGSTNGAGIDPARTNNTYTILDDDNAPVIRIRGVNVGDTRVNDASPEFNNGPNGEARFLEGSGGTTNTFTFTVELLSAGNNNNGKTRQPEVLENGAAGPLVTSYQNITFNYDFLSGNGVDPTASGQSPDNAVLGTDFTGPAGGTGNASITAGQHSTTIPFIVVGDNQDENNESFIARVLSPTNVTNTQGTQAYGVILDDDAPNVTISSVTVTEGAPGTTTTARFLVELSRPSIQQIKINFSTTSGTARSFVPGLPDPNTVADFVGRSGTLTFAPFVTQQFIEITVNGDDITENDETFTVTIVPNPGDVYPNFVRIPETVTRGLTFTNGGVATGTILNDDTSQVTIANASVVEGSGTAGSQSIITFTLTLTGLSSNAVSVTASTLQGPTNPANGSPAIPDPAPDGTDGAVSGDDFVQTTSTVTFPPATTQAIFQVLVNSDTIDERNEIFFVDLSNPSANAVINSGRATGTILDDDGPTVSINAVNDISQPEGSGGGTTTFNFPVTLSAPSKQTITVNYQTLDGDGNPNTPGAAISSGVNADFVAVPQTPVATLTFAPGTTTANIPITVNGDNIIEPDEFFTVLLNSAVNANPNNPIGKARGIGTISNDDGTPPGTDVISVASQTVVEGQPVTFTITLSNPSTQRITVDYQTVSGSATSNADATPTNPSDFQGTNGVRTAIFNPATSNSPGQTTFVVTVPTVADNIDETDETFTLVLSNPTGGSTFTGGNAQATGTIQDNNTQNVFIDTNSTDAMLPEGDSGTKDFVFHVRLGTPGAITPAAQNAQDVVLNYTTIDGTATAPSDYQATTGQVTIAAGQNSADIVVPVVGDMVSELDENFTVMISLPPAQTPARATLINTTATGNILNDDAANISFAGNVSQAEGDAGTSNFTFTVQLSNPSDRPISVNYNTTAGTVNPATPGVDFTAATDTITFAPGATTQSINVSVIGDTLSEANETFTVTLSAATNGATITGATSTGTILDDDNPPSLAINDVSVLEGNSGMTNANFTVTLTPASGQVVTVNYNTADGTAMAGSDYTATSNTVTFLAGQTSQVITVPVLGDTLDEINETFTVNLIPATATNATVADAQGIGTITDDDGPSIVADDVAIGESAGSVTIPVTLTASSPQAISVDYSTADISATAGSDYTAKTGTLTFPANSTAPQNITISILNDAFNEATETFAINFSNAVNATVPDPQTIVTINDDDAAPTISIGDATVTEGNTGTVNAVFNVNLNTPSLQNVTVAYTTASGTATVNTDFASTAGNLVFAPGQTSKTITVPVNGDTINEGDETFTVNLSGPTGATIADGLGLGTIIDDDLALLTLNITPNTLAEGNSAQGTVTRNTQAQPALTVTLTSSNPSLVAVPATVIIPAGSASATFQVQAVEDQVAGPGGSSTITARAANFTPASAAVAVTDNDTPRLALSIGTTLLTEGGAAATATLSRNTTTDIDLTVTLNSSDTNSVTVPPTVTIPAGQQSVTFAVTPVDNAVADGTRTVTISATRAGFTPPTVSVTVTVNDNDNAAVVVTPTTLRTAETGTSVSFTVRLASQPTANVVVNLVNGDTTEGALSTTSLTFTPQNFAQEQTVTVTGVDDQITDGPITYFITTTLDSTDVIYAAINPADVQVTNTDNDVAGFIVTPRGVRTSEAGGSGTFSIRLTSQPTANVVIGLSVDNPREATLSTSSLTFTPQNFASPQAVVVTGRNDDIRDGTVIYNIITAPAVSGDPAYNGLNPPDVKAASTDNDASSIVVQPLTREGLIVTEGQRSFFTIRLTSEPTSPVRISLSSSDPSEASLPQPVVVLSSSNFREGVQVPVDGVRDNVADGPQRFLIRTDKAESLDRLYNLPGAAIADIGGICRDIDTATLIIAGPTSATTSEDGTSTQFSVRLSSRPVSPVRVQIASSDLSEGVVENSANATLLTFTADNFSTPQIVTVTGRDDAIEDGPQRYNINLRAQTASGTFGSATATVPLVNTDNDDLTKPVISLTGVSGSVLRPGDLRAITGQATDANGVARVSVVIQKTDGPTPTFLNADGTFGASRVALPATFNATTGQFSLAIPGGTLPIGTYVVEATATDRAGNVSTPDRLSFTISNQLLAITIATPADGSVITGTTNVTGTVRSQTGSAISTVTVTVQSGAGSPRNVPVTLTGNTFSTDSLGALAAGTYTVRVTATDAAGNRQTATSTFSVDTIAPTAVTITNPTNNAVLDNITTISGTASDNAGGSGIARVEVVILRNTDGRYFNGRTFVNGFATAPATVSGNNFVLNISGGLPADPDPLNATYTLQAIAFDRADNSVRSEPVLVFLSSNGSAPGTVQASQVQLSPFTYSAGEAKASEVILNFTGALNASAAKVDNYQVTVNGAALAVDSAAYRGSSSKVVLAESLEVGDKVEVTYNLQDAQGRTLKGKAALTAR